MFVCQMHVMERELDVLHRNVVAEEECCGFGVPPISDIRARL